MSDNYFKGRAQKISDEIKQIIRKSDCDLSEIDIEYVIYITLKEVARDQRYACIDSIRYPEFDNQSKLQNTLHNAEIEDQ